MSRPNQFVVDGFERACAALESTIRAEVRTEYASQMSGLSFLKRLRLKLEMNREVRRRIHAQAPPDALY